MAEGPGARRAFHELVAELDYPMFIATTRAGDERAGCLLGFATQCSIDPPRFLVCLSDKNYTCQIANREWHEGPHGLPILAECDNWFAGAILARHDLGDHVGFVLEPIAASSGTPLDEFTFHRARRIEPGHEA